MDALALFILHWPGSESGTDSSRIRLAALVFFFLSIDSLLWPVWPYLFGLNPYPLLIIPGSFRKTGSDQIPDPPGCTGKAWPTCVLKFDTLNLNIFAELWRGDARGPNRLDIYPRYLYHRVATNSLRTCEENLEFFKTKNSKMLSM